MFDEYELTDTFVTLMLSTVNFKDDVTYPRILDAMFPPWAYPPFFAFPVTYTDRFASNSYEVFILLTLCECERTPLVCATYSFSLVVKRQGFAFIK